MATNLVDVTRALMPRADDLTTSGTICFTGKCRSGYHRCAFYVGHRATTCEFCYNSHVVYCGFGLEIQANISAMVSNEDSLRALETLMNEFFDGRTTNDRKREIETLLASFGHQQGAWRHCLYFLSNTGNEYVMMYSMTVTENLINKQWVGLAGVDKIEIRCTLFKFLLANHKNFATYIRNKLVKLVVDIGRLDWPHFYPEFFSSTISLLERQETLILGLVFLQTTSEELASPREDLSTLRKDELHRLLLEQVPSILGLLTGILESILDKQRHVVTATPPPSPTHGSSDSPRPLFSSSPLQTGHLLNSVMKSLAGKSPCVAPQDAESQAVCAHALSCLAHLFSWIPLSANITPHLLSTIFQFANLGCSRRGAAGGCGPLCPEASGKRCSMPLGILAMSCVNEILSKNCVPSDFEEFLLQMFQNTLYALQQLVTDDLGEDVVGEGNILAQLDQDYLEKFTEFLRLFMGIHFRRFESNSRFPVLEFLALLFKYTLLQPSHDSFFSCLEIWNVFLEYLAGKLKDRQADRESVLGRYREALLALVDHIVRKARFKYNQSELEELDNEALDDDLETEWQHFLRRCLETVAKVTELMPEDSFSILYPPFQESMEVYFELEKYVCSSGDSNERRLNVTVDMECRRLHCTMRDLSSLLQTFGLLATQFTGEAFAAWYTRTSEIVQRVIHMAAYGSQMRLFEIGCLTLPILRSDFVEVHAQTLATLRAFTHWIDQLHNEAVSRGHPKDEVMNMVSAIVNSCLSLLRSNVPGKVTMAAAQLLNSLTRAVRPVNVLRLSPIQELFGSLTVGRVDQLSLEVQILVYQSLNNILLLPWRGVSDNSQQWEERSHHHATFVRSLSDNYRQIRSTPSFMESKELQEQAKPVIKDTLLKLQGLVESVKGEGTRCKQICYQSCQECLHVALSVFPVYLHQSDISEQMLGFFLVVFEVLRVQMGATLVEQIIQTFLNLFTREQLTASILQENSAGSKVVEKLLKIVQLVVQEHVSAFKVFLPSTINLCMEYIYPILAERPSPDVKPTLFELLYQILLNHWRYFFKSSVLTVMGSIEHDDVDNQTQFVSIMKAFGQSFLQPDIAIFRQNLEALESLNNKWKLYHKAVFKQLLFQFVNVLFQVLVHKSHDLLQEEVGITIYNMAAVDFESFFGSFLPQFLQSCEGIDDNQKSVLSQNFKTETDLPSFTRNIHRFVNDLRYYKLCNSSLPMGTVRL